MSEKIHEKKSLIIGTNELYNLKIKKKELDSVLEEQKMKINNLVSKNKLLNNDLNQLLKEGPTGMKYNMKNLDCTLQIHEKILNNQIVILTDQCSRLQSKNNFYFFLFFINFYVSLAI